MIIPSRECLLKEHLIHDTLTNERNLSNFNDTHHSIDACTTVQTWCRPALVPIRLALATSVAVYTVTRIRTANVKKQIVAIKISRH